MASEKKVRVIPLKQASGSREAWSKPTTVIFLWTLVEHLFVTNPLQVSSRLRRFALRAFGAKIGNGVILRPRLRVKFPWNLQIGDNCWVGEGVWIHNQDKVRIGNDVCISQETFITTGSHDYKKDMSLVTKPVVIEDGVWICSRAIITFGVRLPKSSVVPAGSVISENSRHQSYIGHEQRFRN